MSDSVNVTQLKYCDICHYIEHKEQPAVAFYDTKTHLGQWANVCEEHFKSYTNQQLGTGLGQRLVYPEGLV